MPKNQSLLRREMDDEFLRTNASFEKDCTNTEMNTAVRTVVA